MINGIEDTSSEAIIIKNSLYKDREFKKSRPDPSVLAKNVSNFSAQTITGQSPTMGSKSNTPINGLVTSGGSVNNAINNGTTTAGFPISSSPISPVIPNSPTVFPPPSGPVNSTPAKTNKTTLMGDTGNTVQIGSMLQDSLANFDFSNWNNIEVTGDSIWRYFEGCLPCLDRIRNADKLGDLFSIPFTNFYQNLFDKNQFLNALRSMFDDSFMKDICSLLQFLNFMCIPDLYAIWAALKALLYKFITSLNITITGIFSMLIGTILKTFFQKLLDLLMYYIDLILSPIQCVIDAMYAQIMKLPNDKARNWATKFQGKATTWNYDIHKKAKQSIYKGSRPSTQKYMEEDKAIFNQMVATGALPAIGKGYGKDAVPKNSPKIAADPHMDASDFINRPPAYPLSEDNQNNWLNGAMTTGLLNYVENALTLVTIYVEMGIDYITGIIDKLFALIANALKMSRNKNNLMINIGMNIANIGKIVGFIIAIINAIKNKSACGINDTSTEPIFEPIDDFKQIGVLQQQNILVQVLSDVEKNNLVGRKYALVTLGDGNRGILVMSPEDIKNDYVRDNTGQVIGKISEMLKTKNAINTKRDPNGNIVIDLYDLMAQNNVGEREIKLEVSKTSPSIAGTQDIKQDQTINNKVIFLVDNCLQKVFMGDDPRIQQWLQELQG